MLYRRYCVIFTLLVAVLVILVVTSRTANEEHQPEDGPLPLAQRIVHPRAARFSPTFQWGLFEEKEKPTKKKPVIRVVDIVRKQSKNIAKEMKGYQFPEAGRPNLKNYVPARGGRPMSYFVLSTWTTQHSLVGDLLNTLPGNFYFHEPLNRFGMTQLNTTQAKKALVELKHLMKCNFRGAPKYMKDQNINTGQVRKNERLWSECKVQREFCFSAEFLNVFCQEFPIKSMNIVRLRLAALSQWLSSDKSDIRVILLVRDPRAVIQARQGKKWCKPEPDCANMNRVCKYMSQDLMAYQKLVLAYPNRIQVLRYEDLALDPFGAMERLTAFLGAPFTNATKEFLQTRTRPTASADGSTVRQLKESPFIWKNRMTFERIETVQKKCLDATTGWGYPLLNRATHADPYFLPLDELPEVEEPAVAEVIPVEKAHVDIVQLDNVQVDVRASKNDQEQPNIPADVIPIEESVPVKDVGSLPVEENIDIKVQDTQDPNVKVDVEIVKDNDNIPAVELVIPETGPINVNPQDNISNMQKVEDDQNNADPALQNIKSHEQEDSVQVQDTVEDIYSMDDQGDVDISEEVSEQEADNYSYNESNEPSYEEPEAETSDYQDTPDDSYGDPEDDNNSYPSEDLEGDAVYGDNPEEIINDDHYNYVNADTQEEPTYDDTIDNLQDENDVYEDIPEEPTNEEPESYANADSQEEPTYDDSVDNVVQSDNAQHDYDQSYEESPNDSGQDEPENHPLADYEEAEPNPDIYDEPDNPSYDAVQSEESDE